MVQALNIANGNYDQREASQAGLGRVDQVLALASKPAEMIDHAFFVAAGRPPSEDEREMLMKEFAATKDADRRSFVEDLLWSLLSSKEFMFNH